MKFKIKCVDSTKEILVVEREDHPKILEQRVEEGNSTAEKTARPRGGDGQEKKWGQIRIAKRRSSADQWVSHLGPDGSAIITIENNPDKKVDEVVVNDSGM